jgi:hypothetical protein
MVRNVRVMRINVNKQWLAFEGYFKAEKFGRFAALKEILLWS